MKKSRTTKSQDSRVAPTGTRFAVSALSLALMAAFAPAHAEPVDNPVTTTDPTTPTNVTGQVTTHADNSAALQAYGGTDSSHVATIDATDATVATYGANAAGVVAGTAGTALGHVDFNGGSITTNGRGSAGAIASNGGTINLSGTQVNVNYANDDPIQPIDPAGLYATGAGSAITATDTNLTMAADGDGSGDPAVGVKAGQGASVSLTGGSVTMTGDTRAYGLQAIGGNSTVTAQNTAITTSGTDSFGAYAYSGGDGDPATLLGSGTVSLTGGTVSTTGNGSVGLLAANAGAVVNATGVTVSTTGTTDTATGNNAYGAWADAGQVNLADSTITTSGAQANGVVAEGAGADANVTGGSITTNGRGAAGAVASDGGTIELSGTQVNVNYANNDPIQPIDPAGLYATGAGSAITAKDTRLTMAADGDGSGDPAVGVKAGQGASVSLTGGSVTMTGDTRAYGLQALGGGSTVTAQNTAITTSGTDSFGAYAYAGIDGDPSVIQGSGTVNLTGGTVSTTGNGSVGLLADDSGAVMSATGVTVATTGTTDTATGNEAYGAWALDGGRIDLTNGMVTTSGDQAYGVASDGSGSVVNVTGGNIATNGAQAAGVEVSGTSTLTVTGANVAANGAGSPAASVANGGTLTLTGSTLTSKSDGISVVGNGTVNINNTTVNAAGASIASTLASNATQDITVGAGSNLTQNDGTLLQVSRSGDGVNGIVNLTVQSGSTSTGAIVDDEVGSGTGTTNFTVENGANWSGTATGLSDATVGAGGNFTHTGGGAIAGNVTAQTGSTVTFDDAAVVGGNVSGTGSAITFNDSAAIGGDLSADGGSIKFSKAGVTNSIGGNLVLDNGATTYGGTIAQQIEVGQDATVSNGSTLGGNLKVHGALTVDNAVVAPGNSVGLLTVDHIGTSFTGTYDAQVNAAGQADEIEVQNGNVDLSGMKLSVSGETSASDFRLGTTYTLIKADNGSVTGTFADVSAPALEGTLAEFSPVQYGPNTATISAQVNQDAVAAVLPTLTHNEAQALEGAESVAGQNAAANVLFTSQTNASNFDRVSGESYASTRGALIDDTRYIRDAANDRLRSAFSTAAAPLIGATTLDANGKPVAATATRRGVDVWTTGFGSWGHADGEGGSASLSDSTGGFVVGADGLVTDNVRAGALFGYSHSTFDVNSLSSSADSDNYHFGLYGGSQFGNIGIRAGAAYTWSNVSASRSVNLPGFADRDSSSYDAGAAQAFAELGYQLNAGRVALEPFANIAYVNLHTDGFNEAGGDAALHGNGQSSNNVFSTLGLHGSTDFSIGRAALTATGTLGWQHAYGQVTPTTVVSFAGGQGFSVNGTPIARDAAVVALGLSAAVTNRLSLGASYSGQLASGTQQNGFSANLNYKF